LPAFLFAVALLAAGQSSTLTGTLAGQIVMGRLPELPHEALAAAADHPADRHHTGLIVTLISGEKERVNCWY
jgi:hypothetical protein